MDSTMTVDVKESKDEGFSFRMLIPAIVITTIFWFVGIGMWQSSGYFEAFLNFAYLGSSLGLGLGLYAALPRRRKHQGRKLAQFMVGGYLLIFLGVFMSNNVQIEGFFFSFLTGAMGAALMHYLMAKIIGPLIFGRLYCGWACWTAMFLDLLPFTRGSGNVPNRLGKFRYLHFLASALLVLALWYFVGPWIGQDATPTALVLMLIGNVFYYIAAVGLAFKYKDNRAFCKILCPIPTLLKTTSRFSLIKIKGDSGKCTECGACEKVCPMDIEIRSYIHKGKRVTSTECILCQTCINSCPSKALSLSMGFDVCREELLSRV